MSNNAHVNDDEIEIHQLPEVMALQSGMMVAVDSQPTGTKSFNLTTALEGKASASDLTDLATAVAGKAEASDVNTALEGKVDMPETTPAAGQVLTFDGSDNTWANPPEGVYVINYTEVTDIRDVDVDRATTQPTFLKIDTAEPLTISVPTGSSTSYTVYLRPGTLMSLDEVGVVTTSGSYTGPKFLMFGSTYGKEVGGGVIQNADFKITCAISLSAFGGVSKSLTVGGNLDAGGQLFNGSQPFSITTTFFGGKGPGNPATNQAQNALGITFQSHGNMRQQLLMPAEIQDHNFANDSTPEQVQFMGWGVTSNRAGYRTINEVPASTSAESGKVLMVDSAGSPEWENLITAKSNITSENISEQTPTINITRMNIGDPTNLIDEQVVTMIDTYVKDSSGTLTDINGFLIPRIPSGSSSIKRYLQYYWENNKGHMDWKPVNEVPASTSSNAGQVLTVNNSGTPAWQALQPGDTNLLVDVARPLDSTKAITATKTYTEIKQAVDSGKHVILRVQEGATPGYLDAWTEYYTIQSYADDSGTIRFLEDSIFPSVSSSDNRYNTVETRNNFRMLAIFSDNTWKSYSINPSSGIRTDAPKTVSTSPVDVKNNMITPISTSQSTLTVNCIYDMEDAPNFVVEITPTNNLTLTVTASDIWRTATTTLKHSVAAGNTLEAGKTYQVTAVGNCWTLAEFEA